MHWQWTLVQVFKQHGVIAEEKEGREPIRRENWNDLQCRQDCDHQEIKNGCGKNTKKTPDVEAVHVDLAGSRLLIQQSGADEESADGKEELDAHFAQVGKRLQQWSENGDIILYL